MFNLPNNTNFNVIKDLVSDLFKNISIKSYNIHLKGRSADFPHLDSHSIDDLEILEGRTNECCG